jgi:hypothetical protein
VKGERGIRVRVLYFLTKGADAAAQVIDRSEVDQGQEVVDVVVFKHHDHICH